MAASSFQNGLDPCSHYRERVCLTIVQKCCSSYWLDQLRGLHCAWGNATEFLFMGFIHFKKQCLFGCAWSQLSMWGPVSSPGTEPGSSALQVQSPSHWTTQEVCYLFIPEPLTVRRTTGTWGCGWVVSLRPYACYSVLGKHRQNWLLCNINKNTHGHRVCLRVVCGVTKSKGLVSVLGRWHRAPRIVGLCVLRMSLSPDEMTPG